MNIRTRKELDQWLASKPRGWAHIIAVRAAMRAIPYIGQASNPWLMEFALSPFRGLNLSWTTINVPKIEVDSYFFKRSAKANDVASKNAGKFSLSAMMATDSAYLISLLNVSDSSYRIGNLVKSAAEATAGFIYEEPFGVESLEFSSGSGAAFAIASMWMNVDADCDWLESMEDSMQAARRLTREGLNLKGYSVAWVKERDNLWSKLSQIDPNYSVWIDWYERRIRGERAAFDIPGDKYRIEDKKILCRLAEATDKDFWGKGHEYVNATLKGWLEEARARVAPPHPLPEARSPVNVEQVLLQQASPQAVIIDGKLDAAPNTVFDKPQYSDNLANLPSEMLAYTQVILDSLPKNCEVIVRNCFTGFHNELLVRGNRPILNILKAMAASLTAELYGDPDATVSLDAWQLKDPCEWGAGMNAMFGHFFKGYFDLINHFPLEEEREKFIAETPINEIAASGAALNGPVDEVAALIIELGKQGFATDNIVRIIEAHQIYNRDIAQLPSPDQSGDHVTPKRRHVLGTAGFYLHTYSVLGSTASIYALQTVPAVQALMPALKNAADALLGFIQ